MKGQDTEMLLVMPLHGSEGEESRTQVLGLPQRSDTWNWQHPALLQEIAVDGFAVLH